jgi:hypothetical protein
MKIEGVQESVAHLYYLTDYQYHNLGVPHFSEHPLKIDIESTQSGFEPKISASTLKRRF